MRQTNTTYSGAWLAMKTGVEPRVIEARRRARELLGIPADEGVDFLYPVWQFDETGEPLPGIARIVQAARQAGLDDRGVYDLLERRDGMTGSGRLFDSVREGRPERALDAIRAGRSR